MKNNLYRKNNANKFINFSYKYESHVKKFFLFIILFASNFKQKDLYSDKIKVAYYCKSLKNGGVERVTSLLINYLSKEKRFINYLITIEPKSEKEYSIPDNIHRISLSRNRILLLGAIKANNIDILIYNFYSKSEIRRLNQLNKTKIIYYDHSSYFFWIYNNIYKFKYSVYYLYKNCKNIISLIPLENDYLFKKWGINSILMDNPSTFEYDLIIPSELKSKDVIMIGRADDRLKRFDIGIKAMANIINEIPECRMNILSYTYKKCEVLIKELKLEKYVRFVGYHKNIEEYLKNSSLHILPSLSEAYPMVLSETNIFGIPSIIIGLDYLALANKGNVIIFDDNPQIIAMEAIKILKDDNYRKKMGMEARKSMKNRKNDLIAKKWVKLILSLYKGNNVSINKISKYRRRMTEKEAKAILKNQLNLLHKRKPFLKNITLEKLINYSLI